MAEAALNQFESAVRIYKDFEVSDADLHDHDVIFVGRPETNSALAPWSKRIALDYEGSVFRIEGQSHASENEASYLDRRESGESCAHGDRRGWKQSTEHGPAGSRRIRLVSISDR